MAGILLQAHEVCNLFVKVFGYDTHSVIRSLVINNGLNIHGNFLSHASCVLLDLGHDSHQKSLPECKESITG